MYVQGRVINESGFITYPHVQQCVTSAKCIISHHNSPFSNASCVAVHNPSDSICEESFQVWLKPHMHCVLNFIITGKSSM